MCDCVKDHADCIELLLGRQDLEVNATDTLGWTALMRACNEGNAQCAHALQISQLQYIKII